MKGRLAAEDGAPIGLERLEEDVLDGERVFVADIELAGPLGATDVDPVGGAIAGAAEAWRLAEGFQQHGTDAIALAPVVGELAGGESEQVGGEVGRLDPRHGAATEWWTVTPSPPRSARTPDRTAGSGTPPAAAPPSPPPPAGQPAACAHATASPARGRASSASARPLRGCSLRSSHPRPPARFASGTACALAGELHLLQLAVLRAQPIPFPFPLLPRLPLLPPPIVPVPAHPAQFPSQPLPFLPQPLAPCPPPCPSAPPANLETKTNPVSPNLHAIITLARDTGGPAPTAESPDWHG